ncbi:MAG: hypothetical protein U0T85_04730 [Cloacibacterium normanense]
MDCWCFLFILAAIGITVWIATGHLNDNTNGISLIVARIVAVGISIAGATFAQNNTLSRKILLKTMHTKQFYQNQL